MLAQWDHPRPPWLTARLLGPVSLFDRGDRCLLLDRRQWMCLPGGNLAIKRAVFAQLRGFSEKYARSQDRELTVRLLLAGRTAMYVPEMVVYHHLDANRLTKHRFREWNVSEGRMRAGYAFEELFTRSGELRGFAPDAPRILGVSRFMYRKFAAAAAAYVWALATARRTEAFRRELRVRYLWSYMSRRREIAQDRGPEADTLQQRHSVPSTVRRVWRTSVAAAARVLAALSDIPP